MPKTNYNAKDTEPCGIKTVFKKAVKNIVSDDVAGLGFGYLLGEKSALPSGFDDKMKTVGLAHIIVVSGTHLSIIVGAARKLFGRISRLAAMYFSIFLLIFYVSLIGLTPSIVRASFVAILSLLAWYFGREQKVWRTVLFTLGFCLAFNPYFLTNVSFQLSMLAYAGVVIIMPRMVWYFYGRDKPGFIGSTLLSSLSAIIACLPIQLYYFGTINLASLVANLLILPTIPFAMGSTFLTGIFGMVHFDLLANGVGFVARTILSYHIKIVSELYEKTEFLLSFQKNNPMWLGLYAILVVILIIVTIHQNVEIGKTDAGDHDDSLIGFDKIQDIAGDFVERHEISDAPSTKRNEK